MDDKKKAATLKRLDEIKLNNPDPWVLASIDMIRHGVESGEMDIEPQIMYYLEAQMNNLNTNLDIEKIDSTIKETMQLFHERLKLKESDLQINLNRVYKFMDEAYKFPPDWKHFWKFVSEILTYDEFDDLLTTDDPEKYFIMYGEYYQEHYSKKFKKKVIPQDPIIKLEHSGLIWDKYIEPNFKNESKDQWNERFVFPGFKPIEPMTDLSKEARNETDNKLILLGILGAIQNTTANKFDFSSFVLDRFHILRFDRATDQHEDKEKYKEVFKVCQEILKI